jgi:creatinine amidohydrolase
LSIHINELTDPEFRNAVARIQTAIIPVGSLEQHGEHLPISTDSIIVDYISAKVALEVSAFKLPVVYYGISYEHRPMFNISLQSSTLLAVISEICCSLLENGMKTIIILNGHHGNAGILQYVSQTTLGNISRQSNIYVLNYWQLMSDKFDHAGNIETSLLLAIAPNLVQMQKAKPNSKELQKSKMAYTAIANSPGSFPRLTGNGVWGDPTGARVEKGIELLREIVDNIKSVLIELR